MSVSADAGGPTADDLRLLQLLVVRLGAAMNAAGETVYTVQDRLARVAHAYRARAVRISAFPTFLMVTMGLGEPATLELTSVTAAPRLDQIDGDQNSARTARQLHLRGSGCRASGLARR